VLSDTGRGEGAVLSAGQRQLIFLARPLVNQPRVLLLDDATAVIDGASDATLRAALREHVQPTGTAILTVAHRLSTARDTDRIMVLDAGRVLEQGTPAQLLATDSTFAALLALEEAGWDWEHDIADR
jgi:ABC-type multidrug transport system fused ATPase/permease subunit